MERSLAAIQSQGPTPLGNRFREPAPKPNSVPIGRGAKAWFPSSKNPGSEALSRAQFRRLALFFAQGLLIL